MRRRRRARLADHGILDADDVIAERRGVTRRAVHRVVPPADDRRHRPREPRVAGLRRLGHVSAAAGFEPRDDRRRIRVRAAELLNDRERVRERRRVGDRRSGGDRARRVADHVGHRKAVAGAGRVRGEPASLDRGEMLAHGVQRVNIRAGAQQLRRRLALVVERHAVGRRRHQRGGAAGEQHDERLIVFQPGGQREGAAPRSLAVRGRHRVSADDRLERRADGAGRRSCRRDDESGADARPEDPRRGCRHGGRGFARRHDAEKGAVPLFRSLHRKRGTAPF